MNRSSGTTSLLAGVLGLFVSCDRQSPAKAVRPADSLPAPPVSTVEDRGPVQRLEPGVYWPQTSCLPHPVNLAKVQALPGVLEALRGKPLLRWCVDRVEIDAKTTVVHFHREMVEASRIPLDYGPDKGNRNIYLVDDQGRRYDSLDVGGVARDGGSLLPGQRLDGSFTFPALEPGASGFVLVDDGEHLRLPVLRLYRAAEFPADLRKLLDSAIEVRASEGWSGNSPASPLLIACRFRKQGAWRGDAVVEVAKRRWRGAVAADEKSLRTALEVLAESPLSIAEYVPHLDHADDHPQVSVVVSSPEGTVSFRSESQGSDRVPWAVEWRGQAFVVASDAPARALRLIQSSAREQGVQQLVSAWLDAAEVALRANDLTRAREEMTQAREEMTQAREEMTRAWEELKGVAQLAGWLPPLDERSPALDSLREAEARVQHRLREAETGWMLVKQAEQAFASGQYGSAVRTYDEVLEVDPTNRQAASGKALAHAKLLAWARAVVTNPRPSSCNGSAFRFGKSEARIAGTPAVLPGQVGFEVDPPLLEEGEPFKVRIVALNEGTTPIRVHRLTLSTRINAPSSKSPGIQQPIDVVVPPAWAEVLWQEEGVCWAAINSWSMEVSIGTARGESYTNRIEWRKAPSSPLS